MSQISLNKIVVERKHLDARQAAGFPDEEELFVGELSLKHFTPEDQEGIKDLQKSISKDGLLQSIGLKDPKGGKYYKLIFGLSRLMAVKGLGKNRIEAKIIKTTNTNISMKRLIENVHRRDVNPMETAAYLVEIQKDMGITKQSDLAKVTGKSQSWINKHLSLLRLSPEIQNSIKCGEMGLGAASSLATLPKNDQQKVLRRGKKEARKSGGTKVKEKTIKKEVKHIKKQKAKRQTTIEPVSKREPEQKKQMLNMFFEDIETARSKKLTTAEKQIANEFWDFLMLKDRLVLMA